MNSGFWGLDIILSQRMPGCKARAPLPLDNLRPSEDDDGKATISGGGNE
jgi:hypothetical protein